MKTHLPEKLVQPNAPSQAPVAALPPLKAVAPHGVCQSWVWGAYQKCEGIERPQPVNAIAVEPNSDQLAVALAAQANTFAFGGLLLASTAILGGAVWVFFVRYWAEKEAARVAAKWMAENGPAQVSEAMEMLSPVGGPISPDEVAERLGAEPPRSAGASEDVPGEGAR